MVGYCPCESVKHDDFIQEAAAGTRVGLNLKGVSSDEIKRGYVLTDCMEKSDKLDIEFKKNRFCPEDIAEGIQVMMSAGLQVVTFTVESYENNVLSMKSDHEIAYRNGQRFVILSTGSKLPRIMGRI